jgi:eukaryotic-like serine/threonine-protein kinase
MGVVYRARDQRLHRDVALKVLAPDRFADETSRKRFRNEALALSRLNHPNIASIYEFDSEDGVDFLVMELISGQTLAQKLKDSALSESEALRITGQILEALREAHHHGIIHRDLKPSNALLTSGGRVKILDFGLSIMERSGAGGANVTAHVTMASAAGLEDTAGTLPYMAPETLQGKPSDARADIWSVGVVMYEMLAGGRPFGGKNAYELTSAIVAGDPAPLPAGVSPTLRSVVARCLAKEPKLRYQTAGEVEAALAASDTASGVQLRAGVAGGTRPRVRRFVPAIAAIVVLALVAGFVWRRHADSAVALPAAKQLAILPLDSSAQPADVTAFGDGLDETLAARLSQLTRTNNLEVIPSSQVRAKHVSTVDDANQEFGANLGLEVEVRRAGDKIRVSYNLIDAKTHRQLRGETITASAVDPFGLEDKVCASVINALQLELGPQDKVAGDKHGTTNAEAFGLCLEGRGDLSDPDHAGNIDKAIGSLQKAAQLDPHFAQAYSALGMAYWEKYDRSHDSSVVPKATAACDSAINADGSEAEGYLCLGTVLQGTGKYAEAAEAFEKAEKLDPTSDAAITGAGSAYESLNLAGKAEETYRRAIAVRPQDAHNYTLLGAFHANNGRYADALGQFQQVVTIAPDNYNAYTNVAAIQMFTGDYASAVPTLQKSLAIRKTSSAYSDMGSAYFMLRKFDAAVAADKQAIDLDGGSYTLWGNLGDAYYYGGHREESAGAYEKASELAAKNLDVNPHDAETLASLASFQAMLNKRDSALLYAGRALESSPNGPEIQFTVAQVYNQLGDQREALRWLKKSLDAGFSPIIVQGTASLDNMRANKDYQRLLTAYSSKAS